MRWWRRGGYQASTRGRCSVCFRLHIAKGYCDTHYRYWRLHGVPCRDDKQSRLLRYRQGGYAFMSWWDGTQRRRMRLHRVIMGLKIGRLLQRNEHVDHINRIRDDNRPENLRIATPEENNQNRTHCSSCACLDVPIKVEVK